MSTKFLKRGKVSAVQCMMYVMKFFPRVIYAQEQEPLLHPSQSSTFLPHAQDEAEAEADV